MKKLIWKHRDYKNRSLNSMAKSITEYNTAMLFNENIEVNYSYTTGVDIGTLSLQSENTVENLELTNLLIDIDVYFKSNTENKITFPKELQGTFDCLVSLAAGSNFVQELEDIGNIKDHYIVDISPTAIRETMKLSTILKSDVTDFVQLDYFNINSVKEFLRTVKGTRGFFTLSNVFCYAPTSLLYDVNLRIQHQNNLIELLANDKTEWYVSILTANGENFDCINVNELRNQKVDDKFKVLPWI